MFLAVDLGTSSVKCMLVDPDAHVRQTGHAAYRVSVPQPGWAESAPQDWYDATLAAITTLDAGARQAVRAIGFSGQMHGVVLADASGMPLRPAILWLDTRARAALKLFPANAGARSGNRPAAGMAALHLLWLREHEPDVYRAARWALQPKDWLRWRLGGVVASEASDSSGTAMADQQGRWDEALLAHMGLRSDWLAAPHASHQVVGELSRSVARACGLPQATPLVAGAADTAAAALGGGLLRDGDAQLTTGTGGQIVLMRGRAPNYQAALNCFRSANPPPHAQWYTLAAMLNVGTALEWARGMLGMTWEEAYRAAAQAQPGRLCFLPYLAGERTPLMSADVRAAWIDMSLGESRAELMRAAFEGVAFGLRAGLDAMTAAGDRIIGLRLAGGGSHDPWWRQLLADVLERPLAGGPVVDLAARGAGLLAGLGVGHWQAADLNQLTPQLDILATPGDDAGLRARYARFVALTGQALGRFPARP